MTTKTKKKTTRKKAASKPKAETTEPIEAEEPIRHDEAVPTCPECGAAMVRRVGPHGPFYGCTNFRSGTCKATLPIEQ